MLLPRRGLGGSVSGSASASHSKVLGALVVSLSLPVPGALGTRGAADLVARRMPRGLMPAPSARSWFAMVESKMEAPLAFSMTSGLKRPVEISAIRAR